MAHRSTRLAQSKLPAPIGGQLGYGRLRARISLATGTILISVLSALCYKAIADIRYAHEIISNFLILISPPEYGTFLEHGFYALIATGVALGIFFATSDNTPPVNCSRKYVRTNRLRLSVRVSQTSRGRNASENYDNSSTSRQPTRRKMSSQAALAMTRKSSTGKLGARSWRRIVRLVTSILLALFLANIAASVLYAEFIDCPHDFVCTGITAEFYYAAGFFTSITIGISIGIYIITHAHN